MHGSTSNQALRGNRGAHGESDDDSHDPDYEFAAANDSGTNSASLRRNRGAQTFHTSAQH